MYNPQHNLLAYLKSKGIVPQAYSPLGSTNSPLLKDEVVVEIANKHSLQPADVLLGYLCTLFSILTHHSLTTTLILVAKGVVVLPKSVTPNRIASNYTGAATAATKLDESDITKLDGLAPGGKQKRFIMPPWRRSLAECTCVSGSDFDFQPSTLGLRIGPRTYIRRRERDLCKEVNDE